VRCDLLRPREPVKSGCFDAIDHGAPAEQPAGEQRIPFGVGLQRKVQPVSDEYVFEAIRAGAAGFLVKDTKPSELIEAVRVVAGGDALLSPSVTRRLIGEFAARAKEPPSSTALVELTDREREVMALAATGLSNAQIATRLVVSVATAKTHVSRAMVKLGVRDRAQLVVLAYETGLVRPGWLD
jgi:DNA-binding NarL/FixJ family response regulator